jgi:hypothetical protein
MLGLGDYHSREQSKVDASKVGKKGVVSFDAKGSATRRS